METTLTCYDELLGGTRSPAVTVSFPSSRTTVREIIRARIYQEVQDYNQRLGEVFAGLVKPSEAEQALNGYTMKQRKPIDWQQQSEKALAAFQGNGFFVLIDEIQAEELDQEVVIAATTTVAFIKLVPLVGG
jgi:hypothetical protein